MKKNGDNHIIHFNRPLVPGMDDLKPYLDRILSTRVLTNTGPVHDEFEQAIGQFMNVNHVTLFSSGTLALTLALKALNLKGEVITTPFTAPATLQSIYWNGLVPVFADIGHDDLNISPEEILKSITPDTCAILPVHVFGNPCRVGEIRKIAETYHLKVIYDAAHCFGVRMNNESLCVHGDLSVISFHATKVFNTIEGGAVVSHDEKTKKLLDSLKNTGINGGSTLSGYGLNAKMNELQSAFGLAQFKYFEETIRKRKDVTRIYRNYLSNINGLTLLDEKDGIDFNYAYFPVLIDQREYGHSRDELAEILLSHGIITKKYFHPLVSDFTEFNHFKRRPLPVAEKIARDILCLPIYHDIDIEDIMTIIGVIKDPF